MNDSSDVALFFEESIQTILRAFDDQKSRSQCRITVCPAFEMWLKLTQSLSILLLLVDLHPANGSSTL